MKHTVQLFLCRNLAEEHEAGSLDAAVAKVFAVAAAVRAVDPENNRGGVLAVRDADGALVMFVPVRRQRALGVTSWSPKRWLTAVFAELTGAAS